MFSIKTEPIRDTHTHIALAKTFVCFFLVNGYGKTQMNFLANLVYIHIPMHIQRDREREIYFKEITHNFGD